MEEMYSQPSPSVSYVAWGSILRALQSESMSLPSGLDWPSGEGQTHSI